MCNLYSITTNQAAIIALFRVINRYVDNLPPMPACFDYAAPVIRNTDTGTEMVTMRWACRRPAQAGRPKTQAGRSNKGTTLDRLSRLGDHAARSEPGHRHERRRLAAGAWPRTVLGGIPRERDQREGPAQPDGGGLERVRRRHGWAPPNAARRHRRLAR
jgi:hypothetical protein